MDEHAGALLRRSLAIRSWKIGMLPVAADNYPRFTVTQASGVKRRLGLRLGLFCKQAG